MCSDDEIIEAYALNRLDPVTTADFEAHLLLCKPCRERLDAEDNILSLLRRA